MHPTTASESSEEGSPALPRLAYRVNEVAAMLGVSERTVKRMTNDGRLRSIKTLGLRPIPVESVEALLSGEARS